MSLGPSIHVAADPINPGQFLACCGILEVAERLWSDAEGWFVDGSFNVSTAGNLVDVLCAITNALPEELLSMPPDLAIKPLVAPLRLSLTADRDPVVLDSWMTIEVEKGTVTAKGNQPWNFWSGQQTSLRIWRTLRSVLISQIPGIKPDLPGLFSIRLPLSGRFGFDPGAAWNALDVGFSPNEQGMQVASSPAVELLAAIGLQRFRPVVSADRTTFTYATWQVPLPPLVAAAVASGTGALGLGRPYRGRVVSRGSYAALGTSTPL